MMIKDKNKISKIDLLIKLIVKVKKDDIFALASQLAYYLILAFFPFVISLVSIVGFVNMDSQEVLKGLMNVLPTSVFELMKSTIAEVLVSQNTSLFGISLLVSIWMSASGFKGVIKGINKAYNIREDRSYIKRTAIAIVSTIFLALTILLALIVLVFGEVLGKYIISIVDFNDAITVIWLILRYGFMMIILLLVFSAIYRYIPVKRLKWREVLPGAIVATVGWMLLSVGFSFYINNFNNYSKFYGSLAAIFILMLWIFLTSIILIFGVEVNSILVETTEK